MTDNDEIRMAVEPYIDKLRALTTPGEIRDFLVAEGVRGIKGKPWSCPVAVYVRRGSGHTVSVQHTETSCLDSGGHLIRGCPTLLNTVAMSTFMSCFDCGHYPELELR